MERTYTGSLVLFCLLLASCSSGSKTTTTTTPPSGTVQFTSPMSSPVIDAGESVTLTANMAVMWSLQGELAKPVGQLSNTTTASTTVTYMAPSSVSNTTQVIVVATSATDSSQTAELSVVINQPPAINPQSALSRNTSCVYSPFSGGAATGASGTVGASYSLGSTVDVAGGTGTAPFTWSVASGSLPVGTTLQWGTTTFAPSVAYLYGAPVSAGCSQVALQVTDATGATAVSPVYFLVIVPPALKVQVPNHPDAYSDVAYPQTGISVSGGVPPYQNWSLFNSASSPLPPGMGVNAVGPQNTSAAVVSGTPNGDGGFSYYTSFIQVTDSQTPYPAYGVASFNAYQFQSVLTSPCVPSQNANGSEPITTNLPGMNGSYAFLLKGFDANGPVVIAGSFTTDGAGNVSGGVEDAMRTTGSRTGIPITGGSYSIVVQNTDPVETPVIFSQGGCVLLTTPLGTNTFAVSLGGCSTGADPTSGICLVDSQSNPGLYTTGRMIEFDDSTGSGTRASGIVRLQDSSVISTGLSGSYSFGLSGWDSAGGRYAAAGSLTASSGTLSSVAADINDAGALQSAVTGGSGTYAVAANGRSTGTLTVGTASLNLAIYQVTSQEALLATTGTPSAANPIVSGEAIGAAGPFSALSLQNTHIFHMAGLAATGPDASIGILSFDGAANFSGTQYEDQADTVGTTPLSGTYAVDSATGRVAFQAAPGSTQNLGDHPLVGYVIPVPNTLTRQNCVDLASCVTGFLLSTDATAEAGQLEFQTSATAPPPPFSSLYFANYYFYGTDEGLDTSTPLVEGASNANPNGAHYAAVQSVSNPSSAYCQPPNCPLLIPNETLATGGYAVNSNGTGSLGAETISVTNGNVTYYIDESPVNFHPSIVVVEQ